MPRVKIESIGKSDEDRELVVIWISSDANMRNLQHNRDNLAKIADPRGMTEAQARALQFSWDSSMEALFGRLHPAAFARRAEQLSEAPATAALAA